MNLDKIWTKFRYELFLYILLETVEMLLIDEVRKQPVLIIAKWVSFECLYNKDCFGLFWPINVLKISLKNMKRF